MCGQHLGPQGCLNPRRQWFIPRFPSNINIPLRRSSVQTRRGTNPEAPRRLLVRLPFASPRTPTARRTHPRSTVYDGTPDNLPLYFYFIPSPPVCLPLSLSGIFILPRAARFCSLLACEYSSAARMTPRHSSDDSTAVRLRKMSAARPGTDCSRSSFVCATVWRENRKRHGVQVGRRAGRGGTDRWAYKYEGRGFRFCSLGESGPVESGTIAGREGEAGPTG